MGLCGIVFFIEHVKLATEVWNHWNPDRFGLPFPSPETAYCNTVQLVEVLLSMPQRGFSNRSYKVDSQGASGVKSDVKSENVEINDELMIS